MASFNNLRGSSLRRRFADEDLEPSSGLANLADCMLVLACGLMVALVVAWDIDITSVTEVVTAEETHEVSNLESITGDLESGGNAYVDMGKVYKDPETGKLYMVEESIPEEGTEEASDAEAVSDETTETAASLDAVGEGDE